jgi:hypothetical protein
MNLKVRPKLMGNHLGGQKGAWLGLQRLLTRVSILILGFCLRSQGLWIIRGNINGKRVPLGGGFLRLSFVPLS